MRKAKYEYKLLLRQKSFQPQLCFTNYLYIMLVCNSITAMQRMLDICSREAEMLDFSFNTAKSVALRIGPRFKHACAPLVLAGASLEYVHQNKYLGLLLKASRKLKCSFDQANIKVYRFFNAMCYRAKNAVPN